MNEILTATVGLSTSQYIGREITLLMKRELAYFTDTVQEISHHLSFDESYACIGCRKCIKACQHGAIQQRQI